MTNITYRLYYFHRGCQQSFGRCGGSLRSAAAFTSHQLSCSRTHHGGPRVSLRLHAGRRRARRLHLRARGAAVGRSVRVLRLVRANQPRLVPSVAADAARSDRLHAGGRGEAGTRCGAGRIPRKTSVVYRCSYLACYEK